MKPRVGPKPRNARANRRSDEPAGLTQAKSHRKESNARKQVERGPDDSDDLVRGDPQKKPGHER